MEKDRFLKMLEEGVLNSYIEEDYSKPNENVINEPQGEYNSESAKYEKLAKKILFKFKMASRKTTVAKILSITEARNKLRELSDQFEGQVFTLFKNHIEKHGLKASYRNFESMTELEMKNILEQINFTEMLDEIEAELNDE